MTNKPTKDPNDLTVTHLECRSFRHQPRFVTDRATTGSSGRIVEFVRITECVNCTARFEVTYSVPDFRPIKRKTIYPDGYLMKGTRLDIYSARMSYLSKRSN